MIRHRLGALALIAALVLGCEPASACSCQGPPETAVGIIELLDDSDIVLLGRLEEGNLRIWAPEGEEKREFSVAISPIEWFKGEYRPKRVEVVLAPLECLSGFNPGNSVLIFASKSKEGDRLETHSCLYLYELARPEYPLENVELRKGLARVLDVLRSRP